MCVKIVKYPRGLSRWAQQLVWDGSMSTRRGIDNVLFFIRIMSDPERVLEAE